MLTAQIMKHFHIAKDWSLAGYYETERIRQLCADIETAILGGKLVALSGAVGSNKTVTINRLQQQIATKNKIIVARSLSIDKPRVVLPALITALFLDISGDPDTKVPTQPERRERLLQELIRRTKKPVALFIDEAHDLHGHTLNGLKRLVEIIEAGGGTLSIVLVRASQTAERPQTLDNGGNWPPLQQTRIRWPERRKAEVPRLVTEAMPGRWHQIESSDYCGGA